MNAERLHAIALALREDNLQTDAPSLLSELATALQQLAQNPADESAQQRVSSSRQQLDEKLGEAPSNDFSPAWRQALEELGVGDLFGERLRDTVREIFERNEITPAAAAEELNQLSGRLSSVSTTLESLIAALEALNIGAEQLDFGEFEVGVLIPRAAVSNELRPLAVELRDLDRILLPFRELTTCERPDYKVRSISSSAFQVFLQSPGATATCIAVAVERVIALYKQLLEIRLARKQLKDAGMTDETLSEITAYADKHMTQGIEKLAGELLKEFGKGIEPGRKNELRMEIKTSLTRIANRVDLGYSIEVRAGLPPADEEEEPGDEGDGAPEPEAKQHVEAISARQEGLKFMKLSGSPILSLPESHEKPEEKDKPDGSRKGRSSAGRARRRAS